MQNALLLEGQVRVQELHIVFTRAMDVSFRISARATSDCIQAAAMVAQFAAGTRSVYCPNRTRHPAIVSLCH